MGTVGFQLQRQLTKSIEHTWLVSTRETAMFYFLVFAANLANLNKFMRLTGPILIAAGFAQGNVVIAVSSHAALSLQWSVSVNVMWLCIQ